MRLSSVSHWHWESYLSQRCLSAQCGQQKVMQSNSRCSSYDADDHTALVWISFFMADTAVCSPHARGAGGEGLNHHMVELAGTGDPRSGFAIPTCRADLRQYFFCCPIVIYRILD